MEMIFIYTLICPINNVVKYIGITNNRETRLNQHKQEDSKSRKGLWIKMLRKKKKIPIMKVIDMVTEDQKHIMEKYYIKLYIDNGFDLLNSKIASVKTKKDCIKSKLPTSVSKLTRSDYLDIVRRSRAKND